MSSEVPETTPEKKKRLPDEIRLYSHSSLFYWWPVWAVGFILALVTRFNNQVMMVVPAGAEVKAVNIINEDREAPKVFGIVPAAGDEDKLQKEQRPLRTYPSRGPGVLFTVVLILVIIITNVPLRGMWSVLIIMFVIMLSIIFALAGMWDRILSAFELLDIRINMAGYITISLVLFVVWLITFLLFDRQLYMIFKPGSFKVRLEIGAGEKQYDTIGMTIEKVRSDLFRHWVLGLGSGDMIVRTSGADSHEFRLNNVLFVGKKLQIVEEMQRIRQERDV